MFLRIHRYLAQTNVEGPGVRACAWVQGCPIRCLGCAVPETWPARGGEKIAVQDLAARILSGPKVEGVTFVGGEPFAQATALALLGRSIQVAGLSVVTFTGYVLEQIQASQRKSWHELLAVTDLLIDGPYRRDLATTDRAWVGSSNQRYHFLTPRYRHLQSQIAGIRNRIEVRLYPDGQILVNGMIQPQNLNDLFDNLADGRRQDNMP